MHIVVIGSGPAGLASALHCVFSKPTSPVEVTILEKREFESSVYETAHPSAEETTNRFHKVSSRRNHLQLGHYALQRLRTLAEGRVWSELQALGAIQFYDQINFQDTYGSFSSSSEMVIPSNRDVETYQIPSLADAKAADVIANSDKEISGVSVRLLQLAMYNVAQSCPEIKIHFGVSNVEVSKAIASLEKDVHTTSNSISDDANRTFSSTDQNYGVSCSLRPGTDGLESNFRVANPDLVILAEGARREILCGQILPGGREDVCTVSPKQHYLMSFLNQRLAQSIGKTCIWFDRRQPKDLGSKEFMKNMIVGSEVTEDGPILFTQVGHDFNSDCRESCVARAAEGLKHMVTECSGLKDCDTFPQDLGLNADIGTIAYTVQDSKIANSQYSFGRNVVVIGDAARTGHFASATGCNLALVCDLNAISSVLSSVKSDHQMAFKEFDQSMERTAVDWHAHDLRHFYESVSSAL